MNDLINLSLGNAGLIGLLGYLVVFIGLILLMIVVIIMGRIMVKRAGKLQTASAELPAETASKAVELPKAEPAKGTAGELKLYDTDPRDAAMIMAIVADNLGKPINELRFKSIREVKE
jgi:Oxaloacetate decarboxylase, gamma chain.